MIWKLDEALRLVRILQPDTRQFGYHLCLGGGVLNKGESEKDLDLYFLPMGKDTKADALVEWLTGMWGEPKHLGAEYDGNPPAFDNPTPPTPTSRNPWEDLRAITDRMWAGAAIPTPAAVSASDRQRMEYERLRTEAARPLPYIPWTDVAWEFVDNLERSNREENERALHPSAIVMSTPPTPTDSLWGRYTIPPTEVNEGSESFYKYKLKFLRGGVDRIDVFVG